MLEAPFLEDAITPMNAVSALGLIGLLYLLVLGVLSLARRFGASVPFPGFGWEHPIGLVGLIALIVGNYIGLFVAPSETFMGDVGRILYVHVPAAWLAMITFTIAFACALGYLMGAGKSWDWATEAACEVGVMETLMLLVLGSIFARPTWGVWWSWDPRLTSSAVMMLTFIGVLLLRGAVHDPDRRATWSSIATILAFVNIPVTYMSVRWWRSLHQIQSETGAGSTIDEGMRWVLYLNTWAFLFLTVWLLARRWRLAELRARAEEPEPLPAKEATA